jgi:hypothetical protein
MTYCINYLLVGAGSVAIRRTAVLEIDRLSAKSWAASNLAEVQSTRLSPNHRLPPYARPALMTTGGDRLAGFGIPEWQCAAAARRPIRLSAGEEGERSDLVDGLSYPCNVWACSGALIKGEVLVVANQAQTLTPGSLEVEVRVRYLESSSQTRLEDSSAGFFHVVRLDF